MHRMMISNWALLRKNLLLTHKEGKCPEDGSGPGAVSLESGQGLNQTGGSTAKPSLDQNHPDSSRIGWETGSRIGSEIGSTTGLGTVPEPVSPSISARVESVSVDPFTPRPWKHQSSHPLDQILSDINAGVQTRSKLKNLYAFYAFLSNIEPKNANEALADSD